MATLRANLVSSSTANKVIVIESIDCAAEKSAGIYRLYASIEVAALIVCGSSGSIVVNLTSAEISLEELELRVPGLRDLLA